MHMLESLNQLFTRDIDKVIQDLNAYENESDIWKLSGDIKNSAGNLSLHLSGNSLYFFGHMLGGSDYERDRENEFNAKGVSREDLIAKLVLAKEEVNRVLPGLTEDKLDETVPNFKPEFTFRPFVLHLYNHFGYHAGQINYHRRILGV